jgi:RNA polymerase sigma-70 factor, ECF subfamily
VDGGCKSQVRQFTELFTANYGPVLAYVQRRVSADLAQDVVAETFLAAWRNIHELPPDPLPWLYRAAHFAAANQRRTLARRGRLDERARLLAAGAIAPDHSDQVTADMELAAAFRVLSEADREVLRLAAWEAWAPRRSAPWSDARPSRPRPACAAPDGRRLNGRRVAWSRLCQS